MSVAAPHCTVVAEKQTWHQTGWDTGELDFSSPTDRHHTHLSSFRALTHRICVPFSPGPQWVSLARWMPSQMAPFLGATSLFSESAGVPQQSSCSPLAELRENFILVCSWRKQSQWQNFFKWTKPQMSHEFSCKMKCLMKWRHFLWSTLSSESQWKPLNLKIQIDFYCVFEEPSSISVQRICCWFFGEKILLGKKKSNKPADISVNHLLQLKETDAFLWASFVK